MLSGNYPNPTLSTVDNQLTFYTGGTYKIGISGYLPATTMTSLLPPAGNDGVTGNDVGRSYSRWSTVHAVSHYGTVYTGPDLAERYPASEAIEAGDLVVFDRNAPADKTVFDQSKVTKENDVGGRKIPVAVRKSTSPYQSGVFGVVSTAPGVKMADQGDEKNPPIALTGRVPVKVSAINGVIHVGDYLTASSIPGVAMKATEPGPTIAIALQEFDGTKEKMGKILAFVRSSDASDESRAIRTLEEQNRDLLERVERLEKLLPQPQ
jgi:hypothetical protein